MSASQAAANRLSGEPGPRGAGPGCSELHSERSAKVGSCGSSKKTQPTARAKKPAYAEPRHSAMGTETWERHQRAPFPVRASSGLAARRRLHLRHFTAARHGRPKGRDYGRREGRGYGCRNRPVTLFLRPNIGTWCAFSRPRRRLNKGIMHVLTLPPFLEFQSYPKIEGRGYLSFPNKTKGTNYEEVTNLTLIFEQVGVPV